MATRTYDASRASTTVEAGEGARGAGWVTFAAIMLGLAGIWNVIDGLLALGSSKVYGVNTVYVFSDLRTWGWIVLILGALQLVAAGTVFTGNEFARWFGILAAGVNALGQLAFVLQGVGPTIPDADAFPPSLSAPPARPGLTLRQTPVCCSRQVRHRPQATLKGTVTRSPFWRNSTSVPASITSPVIS